MQACKKKKITEIAKKVRDIVVNNEQMEAYIKLVKKDFDSDKNVSLNTEVPNVEAEDLIVLTTSSIDAKQIKRPSII